MLLHSPSLGIAYLTSTLCWLKAQEIVRGRLTWFVALSGCFTVSTNYIVKLVVSHYIMYIYIYSCFMNHY